MDSSCAAVDSPQPQRLYPGAARSRGLLIAMAWACCPFGVAQAQDHAADPATPCVKTVRWSSNLSGPARNAEGISPSQESEITREVFRRMGCEAKYLDLPWARALIELELGRLDILPGAFITPERQRYAYFSRPYMRSINVIFVRNVQAKRYTFLSLDDIMESDFRLGVQIGVSYGRAFDALRKNPRFQARLVELTARESAWKMLDLGRIDGLIADEYIGKVETRDLGIGTTVTPTKLVVTDEPSSFAFSKQSLSEDFVRRFDQALLAMIADGTYKRIRESYVKCQISTEKLACK